MKELVNFGKVLGPVRNAIAGAKARFFSGRFTRR
jgi:hypothetical protein